MTNAQIDNNITTDINKSIIWQYDNASKLVALLKMFADYAEQSTEDLFERYKATVGIFDNPTAQDDFFALAIWGIIFGIERPTYGDNATPISNELYFKILRANYNLINTRYSIKDINDYLDYLGLSELGYAIRSDGNMIAEYYMKEGYDYPTDPDTHELTEVGYLMQSGYFNKYPAAVKDNEAQEFKVGYVFGFRNSLNTDRTINASNFDASKIYEVGDFVKYNDVVYKCISQYQGDWDATKFAQYVYNDDKYVQVSFIGTPFAQIPYWGGSASNPHTWLRVGDTRLDKDGVGIAFYNVHDEDYEIGGIDKSTFNNPAGIRVAYNLDIPRLPPLVYIAGERRSWDPAVAWRTFISSVNLYQYGVS